MQDYEKDYTVNRGHNKDVTKNSVFWEKLTGECVQGCEVVENVKCTIFWEHTKWEQKTGMYKEFNIFSKCDYRWQYARLWRHIVRKM